MTTEVKTDPETTPNGHRDIRPVKAVVTLIYGEYADGDLVAEFPLKEELIYRRDFDKLIELANAKTALVEQAVAEQAAS